MAVKLQIPKSEKEELILKGACQLRDRERGKLKRKVIIEGKWGNTEKNANSKGSSS